MAATPEMRASDGDRDRVAAALREHVAEGRLTVDEFNERLESVYQSRTYGELAKLTSDLPEIDLHTLPATVKPQAEPPAQAGRKQTATRAAWASFVGTNAVLWAIWLMSSMGSGHATYPWPLWVTLFWGIPLLVGTVFGTGPGHGHGRERRR
ncbi:hypothetical protein GCM10023194_10970 [Planotetraspora phitsanulokensis]|uniref:DUF1707 domain-containing protein n=1 Tax=Planotetraspora phitsanulokensis TaxID=575192 RepID=A0A8J3XGX0_9ACTN|nr:DUF1707 domain-containing protein [Planotetraspora phitsanulokensis]GII40579.1 hypothetical protein Pph01_55820 [Planotetraspora phitsanulokensis]